MFTLAQLEQAHAKVKTGADFPAYIAEIKALGLITYDYMVTDGRTIYHGENGFTISSGPIYPALYIAGDASAEKLGHAIAIHQQGQTDFITFCNQAAEAGVDKWVIDTQNMLCTYYSQAGEAIIAEPIPDQRP